MHRSIETALSHTADTLLRCWPRRRPARAQLEQASIVSHRGAHDNRAVRENTLAAFDTAVDAGVRGLECDIRYTADGEPVIVHDDDLTRVFDQPTRVADTAWTTLRNRVPEVPHLETFLERYQGRVHFMLELKTRAPGLGEARLLRLLNTLEPMSDFHILSLDQALFAVVRDLPARCRLPVSKLNTRRMLEYALTHDCAGLAGSHVLLGVDQLAELQAAGCQAGTGFVNHRSLLWREIRRGVDWIFSTRAVALQEALNQARSH